MVQFFDTVKPNNTTTGNNYILNRLFQSYPELVTENILKNNMENGYWRVNRSSNKNVFGTFFNREELMKCRYCPMTKTCDYYDYATSFEAAIRRLNKYAKAKYGYDKLYDFELIDGTPVKEYQNFIQVGYNIIPKNNYRNYYMNLPLKDKITINNTIVIINNTILN